MICRTAGPSRAAVHITHATLTGLFMGLGWLLGTTLRARSAVRTVAVDHFAELDLTGAGIRLGRTAGGLTRQGHRQSAASVPVLRIFGDYECAACQRLNRAAVDSLEALADSGLLQLVYHHAPLSSHWRGRSAASVAYCAAAEGRASPVHKALSASVADWTHATDPLPSLLAAAATAGANADSIRACIAGGRVADRVMRDRDLAANLDVVVVPTVFLDHARLDFKSYGALLDHITRVTRSAARATIAS